jgi:predicted amidohydrolase YtcJ
LHQEAQGFLFQLFKLRINVTFNREKKHLMADLVLTNANIITINPKMPTAQGIAIKRGKILKVDTYKEIKQFIGLDTKVLNLYGKTVLPGLIDTHVHVTDFGRCLMWFDLTSIKSIGELKQALKEEAQKTQASKWIIGQGWDETRFEERRMPTIEDLDEAAPDNPVILYREAAMVCVVNSKALMLAGVTLLTPVPSGGIIEKNVHTNKLTGIFRDTATNLVWQVVPEPTIENLIDATKLALQKIVSAGLTTIHWLVLSEVELEIIQKLHFEGNLPVRVNVIVPESLIEKAGKLESLDPLMLRFAGVTINVDGYLDSKEAALNEPYSDDPNNHGKLLVNNESLTASIQKVLAAGLQPVILAMGDKAVETTLKIIEKISEGKIRFRIEQAAVLNEKLIKRLKKAKVVVSIQPKMISTEFDVWSAKKSLGLERARWLHPLKTLTDTGVIIAGGSDCPMEPLNPLLGMQEVVVRKNYPEQRLSVEEALKLYTYNAAFSSGEEQMKGSIEEGKLADLTILDRDPSMVNSFKIEDIKIEMIVVNGEVIKT